MAKKANTTKQHETDTLKTRLAQTAAEYFNEMAILEEVNVLYATPDGFMFTTQNSAETHAKQNEFEVYTVTREDAAKAAKEPKATNINTITEHH